LPWYGWQKLSIQPLSCSALWCDGTYHPKIKVIKDVSACAVLVAAAASVAIAVIVFFF
jgi:hypothetical protein